MYHRDNEAQPLADRRTPSARDNERYREPASGLNANARVFTPSSGNQRQPWQNQQPRNTQWLREGNATQSGNARFGFFQPQGRSNYNNRLQTPPNSLRG